MAQCKEEGCFFFGGIGGTLYCSLHCEAHLDDSQKHLLDNVKDYYRRIDEISDFYQEKKINISHLQAAIKNVKVGSKYLISLISETVKAVENKNLGNILWLTLDDGIEIINHLTSAEEVESKDDTYEEIGEAKIGKIESYAIPPIGCQVMISLLIALIPNYWEIDRKKYQFKEYPSESICYYGSHGYGKPFHINEWLRNKEWHLENWIENHSSQIKHFLSYLYKL